MLLRRVLLVPELSSPHDLEKYFYTRVGVTFHSTFELGEASVEPRWDAGVAVQGAHAGGDEGDGGVEFVRSRCVAIVLRDVKRSALPHGSGGESAKGGATLRRSPFLVAAAGDGGVE